MTGNEEGIFSDAEIDDGFEVEEPPKLILLPHYEDRDYLSGRSSPDQERKAKARKKAVEAATPDHDGAALMAAGAAKAHAEERTVFQQATRENIEAEEQKHFERLIGQERARVRFDAYKRERSKTGDGTKQLIDGGAFIFDQGQPTTPVWGDGEHNLMAPDEGLMIAAPTGVGKTTVAGIVVTAMMGLTDRALGFPVQPQPGRVLYLGMDRPQQIARALHRQLSPYDRKDVSERLSVWQGPPPGVFNGDGLLLKMARDAGASVVVVDSLKDGVPNPSDESSAARWNQEVQKCNAAAVQVIILHHQRKQMGGDSPKPKGISDVYGNQALTAGLGSVLLLWRTGRGLVELSQLKGPTGQCEPMTFAYDHTAGTMTPPLGDDEKVQFFRDDKRTVKEYAIFLQGRSEVTKSEVETARRSIDSMVDAEMIVKAGTKSTGARPSPCYEAVI